jgi:hypothetical protein
MRSKNNYSLSARYLFALFLVVIAASGIALYIFQARSSAKVATQGSGRDKSFEGGKYEASGVTHVPQSDGILFVDDGRPGEVFWMQLDQNGAQTGDIKAIKLGITIEDPEGITTDGSYFYIVGSQSKGKGANQPGLMRFRFDPKTQSIEAAEAISDLKKFLIENVVELKGMREVKAKDDGINIEGLAWDPQQERLLLGLRSPVANGHALIVTLKLRDPRGPFAYDNFSTAETKAIRLPLGGQGIRSIEYDNRSKLFQIIAGATENQNKAGSTLWEWQGDTSQATLREVTKFDQKLKPEGVTRASVGSADFTFIVFDTSRYLRME